MALEKRPLVDVEIPVGDADGEVTERVGRDVDAADHKTVALHRREGSIVPDDLGDRIRRCHVTTLFGHRMRCTGTAREDIPAHSRTALLSTPQIRAGSMLS